MMEEKPRSSDSVIGIPWPWKHRKRLLPPDHVLFEDGDVVSLFARKQLPLEEVASESIRLETFTCCIAGCHQCFHSLIKYEEHYNSLHRHTCGECHRVFPSNYLLEIHLQEWHDPMFDILATKQNLYKCFVEGCIEKFPSLSARKDHMIKMHKYPSNYRFDCSKRKSDSTKKKQSENQMDVDESESAKHTSAQTRPASSSTQRIFRYKVPNNICFGHGVSRGFQQPRGRGRRRQKHWHQAAGDMNRDTKVDLEHVHMQDLMDTLPATSETS